MHWGLHVIVSSKLKIGFNEVSLIQQRPGHLKNSYHQAGVDPGFMGPEAYTIWEGHF